jgi:hypothetical protein
MVNVEVELELVTVGGINDGAAIPAGVVGVHPVILRVAVPEEPLPPQVVPIAKCILAPVP